MNVAAILAKKGMGVITIGPRQTIREAIALLAAHKIGALIAIDEQGKPVGILSERDIVRAAVGNEQVFSQKVGDLMTTKVTIGSPQDALRPVVHTMTEKRFRHLPIMDQDKLVGILSIGDVVKAQRDEYEGEVETLETYIAAD
jgi:CBS domain-containing protein